MPRHKNQTKAIPVATRSSARIIGRNSSPAASAKVAVATRTPVKRKAADAPASTPAAKRGRPTNAKAKVYGYPHAIKLLELKTRKNGTAEQKQVMKDLLKRCHEHQEDIAKRVGDRTLNLNKLRKTDKVGDKDYEVVELLNSRTVNNKTEVEFLVLYENFPLEDCTWEAMSQVDLVPILSFYKLFPGKPGKAIADEEIAARIKAAEESEKEEKKGKGSKTKPPVVITKGKAKKTQALVKEAHVSESE